MKTTICLTSLLMVMALPAGAGLYTSTADTVIPDNNTIGTGSSLQFNVSGENWSLSALTLTFVLQGGYSEDLSGYLRLGNETSSPYYNLTSLIQGQNLSSSTPTTYSINFTTPGFQSAFNGLNPNNTWTLFFADTNPGDQTTVKGWSLDITAVSEPVNVALGIFGGLLAGTWAVRRYGRPGKPSAI